MRSSRLWSTNSSRRTSGSPVSSFSTCGFRAALLMPLERRSAGRRQMVRVGARWRNLALAPLLGCSVSCASVSTSETRIYSIGDLELRVSARAERGLSTDRLFIVINGSDIAEAPFGPEQAAGTVFHGTFAGLPVEARCGHRWRPGIHIGYKCTVRVSGGDPVDLAF